MAGGADPKGGGRIPGVVRTEAVVLHSRDQGEADREVLLLTRDFGKVWAQVRGARKIASRLAGSLEPFSTLEVNLYRGPSRNTVTGAFGAEAYQGLREDLLRYSAALVVSELVEALVPREDVTQGLFALVVGGLDLIARAGDVDLALDLVVAKMLVLMGYAPSLRTCVACGDVVGPEGPYAFSAQLGGVLSGPCTVQAAQMSPPALRTLTLCAEGRPQSVLNLRIPRTVRNEVRGALWAVVAERAERSLKSVAFYDRMRQDREARPGPA